VETNDLLEVDPYAYEAGEYRFSVTAVDDYGLTTALDGESFEIAALPPLVEVVGLNDADNLLGITDMSLDITSQTPIREVNYSMDGAEIETSSTAPYTYRIDPAVIGADDHTLAITVIAEGGANTERNIDFMVDESAVPSDGLNTVIIAAVVIVLLAALAVGYQVGFAGKLTPIPGGGKVALVYEDVLSGKETRYKIRAERTTIGRSPSNDVTLLDAQQRISREHAAIEARGQKWVVEDLKSRMGVLVNGEKIDGTQAIFDGDMLTIGSVVIRFDAPGFSHSEQDRLETIVEDLPPDFNEGVATVPPPARKRSTRLKVDEPSEADTDEIATINDPPEPRRRVTLIKEDSTDDDIKAHGEDKTPSSPRKTAIKPAEPETGLIPEAELPAAPEDDTDQTPISSRTPAINRFPAEEEDLRDTTRPELSEPDSEDDTDT
jgi:pSer/pThr/pTyr-binding forkhead associated (FHA) protein